MLSQPLRHGYRQGRCFIALFLSFSLFCQVAIGQDSQDPVAVPIAFSDIPEQASAERDLLDQSEQLVSRTTTLDTIASGLLEQERVIVQSLKSLKPALAAASSRQALSEIEQTWLELRGALEGSEKDLHARATVIGEQLDLATARHEIWRKTLAAARESDAPPEIIALAAATADELAKTVSSLDSARDRVLSLQGRVGRSRTSVQEALDQVAAEEADLLANLAHRERPPLWGEAVTGVSFAELGARAMREINAWRSDAYSVLRGEVDRVVFQLMILIGAALLLGRARRAAVTLAADDPSVARGMSVFERPIALAMLIALMITPWLYVSMPPVIDDAVGLLLVLPVLRLALPLLDKPVRPALYMLAALYVVDWLRDLVEAAPLVGRIVFLIELLAAIVVVIWLIRSGALRAGTETGPWRKRIRFGLSIALVLLIVAALAAIAGFVRLGVLIGTGVLNSAYLAVLLVALIRAADAIVALALHSRPAQAIKVISNRPGAVRLRVRGLLGIAGGVAWLLLTLDFLALRDSLFSLLGKILFTKLEAGSIAISLVDVLAFGLTIFAALLLARLITAILDEDLYPRVELGRGVPFAISAVVKYGIITLGFVLAVSAMGMGMDRITILLGALGVGAGFGLQNVVNNFVSGLILIFERPVQIGDSIEVGSVTGTIKRLGIRSSTIRSFEGADVTLPNGTLLSDALTNWTMTDRTRRFEIPVGVAYGSNLDQVMELLRKAIENQEGLLEQPAPQVIFRGFGDSSLDFMVRAWVADNDLIVRVPSDVALAINRALDQAGIEIPFPQRDLHVRSVAPEVLDRTP